MLSFYFGDWRLATGGWRLAADSEEAE